MAVLCSQVHAAGRGTRAAPGLCSISCPCGHTDPTAAAPGLCVGTVVGSSDPLRGSARRARDVPQNHINHDGLAEFFLPFQPGLGQGRVLQCAPTRACPDQLGDLT